MNDSISMFIDNELDLDEKIDFVNKIHKENNFYDESLELMEQEKLIRSDVVSTVPSVHLKKKRSWFDITFFNRPLLLASAGAMAVIILFLAFPVQNKADAFIPKRFIIHKPDASNVHISGSFNDWKNIPLKMIGSSGYWQIELNIKQGEYRYVFLIEETERIADPTILTREQDDFGGENTVLIVGA